jgi:hypothetical protein
MIFGTPEYNDLLRDVIGGKRHDLYEKTKECAEAMKVHIYGDKPEKILNRARPREPQEIKNYRLENYEPTTKATGAKALSIVGKIFNPQLSSIKWNNQTNNGKKLEEYTLEYYPRYNSVVKFLAQAGLKKMIADPNGVFAVRPKRFPKTQLEEPEPELKVYGSECIYYYDDDHFLIFIKKEAINGREWHHFHYYDSVNVIHFRAMIINSVQMDIVAEQQYPHKFNEIPVWFLTGETETDDNGLEYYVSFFDPALPFWNKAINHESDLDAAFIMHLHPQKVVVAEECDFVQDNQRCQHGKIPNAKGEWTTCPSCNGSGKRLPIGPFGVHMVTKEKLEAGQQLNAPVQYVSVPVEPTELLSTRVDDMHKKGLAELNMDIVDNTGAVVTQHAGHLAGPDGGRDAVEGDHRAIVLADVPQLQQRCTRGQATRPAHRRVASA